MCYTNVCISSVCAFLSILAVFDSYVCIVTANSATAKVGENSILSPLCKQQTDELDKAMKKKEEWAVRSKCL